MLCCSLQQVWCTFAAMGSHSVVAINIGQITQSIGIDSTGSAMTIIFVAAALGRLGASATVRQQ